MMHAGMDEVTAESNSNFAPIPSSNRASPKPPAPPALCAAERRAGRTLVSGRVLIFPGARSPASGQGLPS